MVSVHFDDTHLHSLDTMMGSYYQLRRYGPLAQPAKCILQKRSGILSYYIDTLYNLCSKLYSILHGFMRTSGQ